MRLLVTGGAGYIGSVATRLFADAGHEVTVLDSLERGHRQAVDSRATLVIGSVGDKSVLNAVVPEMDAIVHFAGYIDVAESMREPDLYYKKNVHEPGVLLECAIAAGVRNLVFSSTAAVYGEPEFVPISEETSLEPINPYGSSKAKFERLIEAAEEAGALKAVRLRYFNVAGAWPDGSIGEAHPVETHIVPKLLAAVMASSSGMGKTPGVNEVQESAKFTIFGNDYPTPDGTCVRDYVHVVDLARAHLAAVEYLVAGGVGSVCNLGSGRGYSNLEVVRSCEQVTGQPIEVAYGARREGDPAVLVAAIDRARSVLGWVPEHNLETMIADAWRWHSSHTEGYDTPADN